MISYEIRESARCPENLTKDPDPLGRQWAKQSFMDHVIQNTLFLARTFELFEFILGGYG